MLQNNNANFIELLLQYRSLLVCVFETKQTTFRFETQRTLYKQLQVIYAKLFDRHGDDIRKLISLSENDPLLSSNKTGGAGTSQVIRLSTLAERIGKLRLKVADSEVIDLSDDDDAQKVTTTLTKNKKNNLSGPISIVEAMMETVMETEEDGPVLIDSVPPSKKSRKKRSRKQLDEEETDDKESSEDIQTDDEKKDKSFRPSVKRISTEKNSQVLLSSTGRPRRSCTLKAKGTVSPEPLKQKQQQQQPTPPPIKTYSGRITIKRPAISHQPSRSQVVTSSMMTPLTPMVMIQARPSHLPQPCTKVILSKFSSSASPSPTNTTKTVANSLLKTNVSTSDPLVNRIVPILTSHGKRALLPKPTLMSGGSNSAVALQSHSQSTTSQIPLETADVEAGSSGNDTTNNASLRKLQVIMVGSKPATVISNGRTMLAMVDRDGSILCAPTRVTGDVALVSMSDLPRLIQSTKMVAATPPVAAISTSTSSTTAAKTDATAQQLQQQQSSVLVSSKNCISKDPVNIRTTALTSTTSKFTTSLSTTSTFATSTSTTSTFTTSTSNRSKLEVIHRRPIKESPSRQDECIPLPITSVITPVAASISATISRTPTTCSMTSTLLSTSSAKPVTNILEKTKKNKRLTVVVPTKSRKEIVNDDEDIIDKIYETYDGKKLISTFRKDGYMLGFRCLVDKCSHMASKGDLVYQHMYLKHRVAVQPKDRIYLNRKGQLIKLAPESLSMNGNSKRATA